MVAGGRFYEPAIVAAGRSIYAQEEDGKGIEYDPLSACDDTEAVVHALQFGTLENDRELCINASEACLKIVEQGEVRCRELGDRRGIDVILESIRLFPKEGLLAKYGWSTLVHAMGKGQMENRYKLAAISKSMQTLISSLYTHIERPEVLEPACHLLARMAWNNDFARIGEQGGIKALLVVMLRWAGSVALQEQCCHALGNLVYKHAANRARLAQHNGLDTVIGVPLHSDHALDKGNRAGKLPITGILGWAGKEAAVVHYGLWVLANMVQEERMYRDMISLLQGLDAVLEALALHGDEPGLQHFGCLILGHLAQNDDTNKARIRQKDGIRTVLASMDFLTDQAHVQQSACFCLHHLAEATWKNQSLITDFDGLDLILQAMDRFPKNAALLESAADAVSSLCRGHDPNRRLMENLEGAAVVVRAMQGPGQASDALQVAGLECVRVLSEGGPGREPGLHLQLVEAGAAAAVAQAMAARPGHLRVQELGCAALANLSQGQEGAAAVGAAGGVASVVGAMRGAGSIKHELLQRCGCLALAHLAALQDVRPAILAAKGVEAVYRVIKTYMEEDADLVVQGCGALAGMAGRLDELPARSSVSPTEDDAANMEAAESEGLRCSDSVLVKLTVSEEQLGHVGVELLGAHTEFVDVLRQIIKGMALTRYFTHSSVLQAFFRAQAALLQVTFFNVHSIAAPRLTRAQEAELSTVMQNHRTMVSDRGVEAVVTALKGGGQRDPATAAGGCLVLGNLARGTGDPEVTAATQTHLLHAMAVEAVVACMRTFPDHAGAVRMGCWALINMAREHAEMKGRVAAVGGVEAAMEAMQRFPKDPAAFHYAAWTLAHVAHRYPKTQLWIGAVGGIDPLVDGLARHSKDLQAVKYGSYALACLAEGQDGNQLRIGDRDGVAAVVGAMRRHPRAPAVQQYCAWALLHLAQRAHSIRAHLADAGALKAIVAAMEAHGGNLRVQHYSIRALENACRGMERSVEEALELGAVELALAAMRAFEAHPRLQQRAAQLFTNLAREALYYTEEVARRGVEQAVIAAMRSHPADSGVQQSAVQLLSVLRAARGAGAAEDGDMDLVLGAMKGHQNEHRLQEYGCNMVGDLQERPKGRREIFHQFFESDESDTGSHAEDEEGP